MLLWLYSIATFALFMNRHKMRTHPDKTFNMLISSSKKKSFKSPLQIKINYLELNLIEYRNLLLSSVLPLLIFCHKNIVALVIGLHVCAKICFQEILQKHLHICSLLHVIWCQPMIMDNSHVVWPVRPFHPILNRKQ